MSTMILQFETYIEQISKSGNEREMSPVERCAPWSNQATRERCQTTYTFQREMLQAIRNNRSPAACNQLTDSRYRESCVALHLNRAIIDRKITDPKVCKRFNGNWSVLRVPCQLSFQTGAVPAKLAPSTSIPSVGKKNILYAQGPDGWINQAQQYNLETVGWTWNAKFADLDNDTWQDLYVANGMFSNGAAAETNHFSTISTAIRLRNARRPMVWCPIWKQGLTPIVI